MREAARDVRVDTLGLLYDNDGYVEVAGRPAAPGASRVGLIGRQVAGQDGAINGIHPWAIPVADYALRYPMLPVTAPRNADGSYHVLTVADGWVRVLPGSPRQFRFAIHQGFALPTTR